MHHRGDRRTHTHPRAPRAARTGVSSALVGAAVAVMLAGCAPASGVPSGWDEPSAYAVTVTYDARDTIRGTYRVMVRNHQVLTCARISSVGSPVDVTELVDCSALTLRQVVGRYLTAVTHRDAEASIVFDASVPTQVSVDWDPAMPHDDQTWTFSDVMVGGE